MIDTEIFDAEDFQDQIENVDLLKQLLERFPEEARSGLRRVREAITLGDRDALFQASTSLKDLAGNYLGMRAFAAAGELERLAKRGKLEAVEEALAICEKEIKSLGKALSDLEREVGKGT